MTQLELYSVSRVFRMKHHADVVALDGVDLTVTDSAAVGVVGQSGAGKSTLLRLALGLDQPDAGSVKVMGKRLDQLSRGELRALRRSIGYVFQDVLESLDPTMTVGDIVAEPLDIHDRSVSRRERYEKICASLSAVGLGSAIVDSSPRALSGGQQQRVGIARALILDPSLIVLDEPTASLDLPIRLQTLNILRDLREHRAISYLFVSHDFSAVEYLCDEVLVMHRGAIVERGNVSEVLAHPQHSHSQELVRAILSPIPETGRG